MSEHTPPEAIQEHVESAIDEICQHYKRDGGNRPVVFERMFKREKNSRLRNQYINENPERFVERTLVWPILTTLGYEYDQERKIAERGRADFVITNTQTEILGEVKILGSIYEGIGQMLRYFDTTEYKYGMVTDGMCWELIKDGDSGVSSVDTLCHGELRGVVADYVRRNDIVGENIINLSDSIQPTTPEEFYSRLNCEYVNSLF